MRWTRFALMATSASAVAYAQSIRQGRCEGTHARKPFENMTAAALASRRILSGWFSSPSANWRLAFRRRPLEPEGPWSRGACSQRTQQGQGPSPQGGDEHGPSGGRLTDSRRYLPLPFATARLTHSMHPITGVPSQLGPQLSKGAVAMSEHMYPSPSMPGFAA